MFNLVEQLHVILTGWSLWPLKLQEAWCSSCFFIFVPLAPSSLARSHFLTGTSSEQITTAVSLGGVCVWHWREMCSGGEVRCGDLGEFILESVTASRKRHSLSKADTPRGKRRPGVGATALSHFHTTSLTDVLVLKQVLVALSVPPLWLWMGTNPSVVTPCQASVQLEVMWRFSSPSC